MAVGSGALAFAHVEYSADESLKTIYRAHGMTPIREVLCYSDAGKGT